MKLPRNMCSKRPNIVLSMYKTTETCSGGVTYHKTNLVCSKTSSMLLYSSMLVWGLLSKKMYGFLGEGYKVTPSSSVECKIQSDEQQQMSQFKKVRKWNGNISRTKRSSEFQLGVCSFQTIRDMKMIFMPSCRSTDAPPLKVVFIF